MSFLDQSQINRFNSEGYLVVENAFDPKVVLDPLIEEYKGVLDSLANELYVKKLIKFVGKKHLNNYILSKPIKRNQEE